MKKIQRLLLLIVFSLISYSSMAQWQLAMQQGGNIYDLIVVNDTMFAATQFGVYRSSDQGQTWTLSNSGFLYSNIVYTIAEWNNTLFAGTEQGVYKSTDRGATWTIFINGLPAMKINKLLPTANGLFAISEANGVFVVNSVNGTWQMKNSGLTDLVVYTLTSKGNRLFVGSYNDGVFVSDNNGNSWTASNNGLSNLSINYIFTRGSKVFTSTAGGLYVSTDDGNNWNLINNVPFGDTAVLCSTNNGQTLLVGTDGYGVAYSNDEGQTWTLWNANIPKFNVYCVATYDNNYWAGFCCGYGIYKQPTSIITGIVNHKENKLCAINVFPNPTSKSITIDLKTNYKNTYLQLYDAKGSLIERVKTESYPTVLNMENLSTGTYFVEITKDNERIAYKKLIKN